MTPVAGTLALKRLAACLSTALALGAANDPSIARATSLDYLAQSTRSGALVASPTGVTRSVNSCADDGSVGTLRQVVGTAASGDIIDLSAVPLACSTITLTAGEIHESHASLTFIGPSDHALTITTGDLGRVFNHSSTDAGYLAISKLTISHGRIYSPGGDARGGCIYSGSSVFLTDSNVTGCSAYSYSGSASGGGIYAKGTAFLQRSQVSGNNAVTYYGPPTSGGGLTTIALISYHSTLSGNSASRGGGAFVNDEAIIHESTFDANIAAYGGAIYRKTNATQDVSLSNSTISGNSASSAGGALFVGSSIWTPQVVIDNSTIAFNTAAQVGGVKVFLNLVAHSSIIANNGSTAAGFGDVYVVDTGGPAHTLTGAYNLIVSSNRVLGGTLTADPRLVPLGNHGGYTRTHALTADSPAVNHGSNPNNLLSDQRLYPFARESPAAGTDIGAYERQAIDDEIFYSGFR